MEGTKTCPDCTGEVPEGAKACKHCGHRFGRSDAWAKWVLAVILAVAAIGVGATVATNIGDDSKQNACEDVADDFGLSDDDC